jgi:hypothetical protein
LDIITPPINQINHKEKYDARKVDQKTLQFLLNRAIKLREAGHLNKEMTICVSQS